MTIPGYAYGQAQLPPSPVSLEELELLKRTLLFTGEDERALRRSREILEDRTEQVLDAWYGFVGSQPHLLASFKRKSDGQPDADYLAAVRRRFGQWILDTADAVYDERWLAWQAEIGRRHHRMGKNRTDGAAAADHIAFRYLPALIYPVTAALKPFLAQKGHSEAEVEAMHQAWVKSVLLQVILWSHPYVKDGDY